LRRRAEIKIASLKVIAEFYDTGTANAIWQALPVSGRASLWGDEIYFTIPVHIELEDGKDIVECGDMGYWPTGNAFCIFFGKTPASLSEEIRPASAVNVFGKVIGDVSVLKTVKSGEMVVIEKEGSQR
jgi:hypothetical protein